MESENSRGIDKYHPDLFWFDGGKFARRQDHLATFAYYFNQAERRGQQVYICNKYPTSRHFNFPPDFGLYNFESGRDRPVEVERPWMDDLNITGKGWGYTGYEGAHTSNYVIRQLIDNVSRGGGLVLSLAPRLDGTIPKAQQQTLLEVGEWLKVNGEAVFGSRRWLFSSDETPEETSDRYIYKYRQDRPNTRWNFEKMPRGAVRYTRKGDTVYILTLGLPTEKVVIAKRFAADKKMFLGEIADVALLGSDTPIDWKRTNAGLVLPLPENPPNDKALVFKTTLQK